MSEETKTADELSDEQLKKVAGGNGNDHGFYRVKHGGAKLYSEPTEDNRFLLDTISEGTVVYGIMDCDLYLHTEYNSKVGFVEIHQLQKL